MYHVKVTQFRLIFVKHFAHCITADITNKLNLTHRCQQSVWQIFTNVELTPHYHHLDLIMSCTVHSP